MGPVSSRQSVELNKATMEMNRAKYELDKVVLDLDKAKRKEIMLKKVQFELQRKTDSIKNQIDAVVQTFRVSVGGDRTDWGSTWESRGILKSVVEQAERDGKPSIEILALVKSEANHLAGIR